MDGGFTELQLLRTSSVLFTLRIRFRPPHPSMCDLLVVNKVRWISVKDWIGAHASDSSTSRDTAGSFNAACQYYEASECATEPQHK